MPISTAYLEEVEIERDIKVELSCSDEELDDHDTKSRKSQGTLKMLSEWTKS